MSAPLAILSLLITVSTWLTPLTTHSASDDAKMIWASIVSGEAGTFWPDGMRLVAWTLESEHWYWGVPAEDIPARMGWYGLHEPSDQALGIIEEVWERNPTESPFRFMQQGKMCVHLGSYQDSLTWAQLGYYNGTPDYRLSFGNKLSLDCYFRPMRKPKANVMQPGTSNRK